MKFFSKIFVLTLAVMTVSLSVFGSLLIYDGFKITIDNEIQYSHENMRTTCATIQIAMMTAPQGERKRWISESAALVKSAGDIALAASNGNLIFDSIGMPYIQDALSQFDSAEQADEIKFLKSQEKVFILATGSFVSKENTYVLIQQRDVTAIFSHYQTQINYYVLLYLLNILITAAVLFVFTGKLTQPIKQLNKALEKYAKGDFGHRIRVNTKDEIGELALSANIMADIIEEKIRQLEEAAVEKDMFMANFSHEIKTPMTSVIGYADLIQQNSGNQKVVKMAAEYIFMEGMRLETLSLKLMKLFMIDKDELQLHKTSIGDAAEELRQILGFTMKDKDTKWCLEAEDAFIWIENDLFKTMIINLVENAVKADAAHIRIMGKVDQDGYTIAVHDDGCGIPEKDIAHITEPFYMVDKSRSRSKNGAGLGLSLVKRIIQLHHAQLRFESSSGAGTSVIIVFPMEEQK